MRTLGLVTKTPMTAKKTLRLLKHLTLQNQLQLPPRVDSLDLANGMSYRPSRPPTHEVGGPRDYKVKFQRHVRHKFVSCQPLWMTYIIWYSTSIWNSMECDKLTEGVSCFCSCIRCIWFTIPRCIIIFPAPEAKIRIFVFTCSAHLMKYLTQFSWYCGL